MLPIIALTIQLAHRHSFWIDGPCQHMTLLHNADAFKKDPDFYAFYRSLEAYRKSLSNPETTLVLSPDSEFFQFFEQIKKVKQ